MMPPKSQPQKRPRQKLQQRKSQPQKRQQKKTNYRAAPRHQNR